VAPEISVRAFVSGDISRCTAFAVAVPEIEVIASIEAAPLLATLQKMGKATDAVSDFDAHKLQKTAVRVFNDQLLQHPEIKFRRSAFQAAEPKVTLLWSSRGSAFPFDFSVNYGMAQHNAALLKACGQMDLRAKHLIFLVRRWAKDRGICHAQKGNLTPYGWTLLVVYFLQVGTTDGSVLPPLLCTKAPDGPSVSKHPAAVASDTHVQRSLGGLLEEFFHFYAETMRWEVDCVCLHRRCSPLSSAAREHLIDGAGSGSVTLCIEDPFQHTYNVASTLTSQGWARFQEELSRATSMLPLGSAEAPQLTNLLEPWVPPEGFNSEVSEGTPARERVGRKPPGSGASVQRLPWQKTQWREQDFSQLGRAVVDKMHHDESARRAMLELLQTSPWDKPKSHRG
jgi:hypothetical protein